MSRNENENGNGNGNHTNDDVDVEMEMSMRSNGMNHESSEDSTRPSTNSNSTRYCFRRHCLRSILRSILRLSNTSTVITDWIVQTSIIALVAMLTYGYGQITTSIQLSIMTTIALVGAVPSFSQYLIPAGIGAFVGGQNIIGTFIDTDATSVSFFNPPTVNGKSYLWLLVLSITVGWVWSFVMTGKIVSYIRSRCYRILHYRKRKRQQEQYQDDDANNTTDYNDNINDNSDDDDDDDVEISFRASCQPVKILDGYAGRLGTTTFLGMNLTMILFWAPFQVVNWNRYYYGIYHVVHVAEEDSPTMENLKNNNNNNSPDLSEAWTWTEEAELAIGYVLAVVGISIVSGVTRIRNQQSIRRWKEKHHHQHQQQEQQGSVGDQQPPKPLNNVLIPVLWALFWMLMINLFQYKHANGLYNGFAVGAYVGMASLQKLPTTRHFAIVGFIAALWGLTLTPFFVGFAGKSGFTSMLGHVTYEFIERYCCSRIWSHTKNFSKKHMGASEVSKSSSFPSLPPDESVRSNNSSSSSGGVVRRQRATSIANQSTDEVKKNPFLSATRQQIEMRELSTKSLTSSQASSTSQEQSFAQSQPQHLQQPVPTPKVVHHQFDTRKVKVREPFMTKQQIRQRQRLQAQQQRENRATAAVSNTTGVSFSQRQQQQIQQEQHVPLLNVNAEQNNVGQQQQQQQQMPVLHHRAWTVASAPTPTAPSIALHTSALSNSKNTSQQSIEKDRTTPASTIGSKSSPSNIVSGVAATAAGSGGGWLHPLLAGGEPSSEDENEKDFSELS